MSQEYRLSALLNLYNVTLQVFKSRYSHGYVAMVGQPEFVELMRNQLLGGDDEWSAAYTALMADWFPGACGDTPDTAVSTLTASLDAMSLLQFNDVTEYLRCLSGTDMCPVVRGVPGTDCTSFREFACERHVDLKGTGPSSF